MTKTTSEILENQAEEATIRAEEDEDNLNLARETLAGDLRDNMLSVVRNLQKPWQQMTEDEQRSLAETITVQSKSLVREMVRVVASDGRKVVHGNLEQITVKDGIKCVVTVSKHDEMRHEILDATGLSILMVVCDADEYSGERGQVEIDPDQPDLPVADNAGNIPSDSDDYNGEDKEAA